MSVFKTLEADINLHFCKSVSVTRKRGYEGQGWIYFQFKSEDGTVFEMAAFGVDKEAQSMEVKDESVGEPVAGS